MVEYPNISLINRIETNKNKNKQLNHPFLIHNLQMKILARFFTIIKIKAHIYTLPIANIMSLFVTVTIKY